MASIQQNRLAQAITVVICALALIIVRNPDFLLNPRLWAEEGSIYIQSYLDNGFWGSVFAPHLGYYSLISNLAAAGSVGLLGLKYAAYGTTYLSLVIMLACVLAPLYLPGKYWDSAPKSLLLVFASIIVSPPETWLNTISLHFYLGLFSIYFLLSDFSRLARFTFWFSSVLLLMGTLTSVTTVILLPFYLIKTFECNSGNSNIRSQRYKTILSILAVGLIVQLYSFFISQPLTGGGRLSLVYLDNLPVGLLETSLYIIEGNSQTVGTVFLFAITLLGIFAIYKHYKALGYLLVLLAYISVVFSVLSLEMLGGARYGYIPSVLAILCFLTLAYGGKGWVSKAVLLFGSMLLLYKMQFYFLTDRFYDPAWRSFAAEYAASVGNCHVRVFPHWEGTDWKIDLDSC